MKAKQIISLLLAVLFAASTFTACADSSENTADTDNASTVAEETAAETEEQWYDKTDLADTDWDGRDFHVLGWDDFIPNFEIYAESETGEVVNDAIYKRNQLIYEKYNATVSQQLESDPRSVLQESVWSAEHLFDLAILPLETISTCAVNGYFYDLKDVENVDTTKSYWNSEANEQLEVMDKLVIATSDFLLSDKRRINLLVYNPSLAENLNLANPVDSVRDGKWTTDMMSTYIKVGADDLNGDGNLDYSDQWGLVMDSYNAFAAFYYGCDNQIISTEADGSYVLTMNTERSVASVDKVFDLICDKTNSFFCEDWSGKVDNCWSTSGDAFFTGRAIFVTMFAQCFGELSEKTDFDYTILPYPKFDETQESYTTLADIYSELFGIPNTTDDPSFAGFMIEALSAAATDTSLYAYYDVACKTKYSYVESNSEMLDLIFDGVIYEKAMIYSVGSLYGIITGSIPQYRKNNFSSLYARQEKEALLGLESLVKDFTDTYGTAE